MLVINDAGFQFESLVFFGFCLVSSCSASEGRLPTIASLSDGMAGERENCSPSWWLKIVTRDGFR
jgi:hypothetical protein